MEINKFDHVVTENTKKNKYQLNDSIYNAQNFDTNNFIYLEGLYTPYH